MRTSFVPQDQQQCGGCRFYKFCTCRRHAPLPLSSTELLEPYGWFPLMDEDDWCGEWEQREGHPEEP